MNFIHITLYSHKKTYADWFVTKGTVFFRHNTYERDNSYLAVNTCASRRFDIGQHIYTITTHADRRLYRVGKVTTKVCRAEGTAGRRSESDLGPGSGAAGERAKVFWTQVGTVGLAGGR